MTTERIARRRERPRARAVARVVVAALVGLAGCSRAPDPGALAGWNVLLITIDTLRADRVGFMGWKGAATPALDDLAASGVVFEEAIAAAPVTLPAHATILTGRYPPAHGALDNGRYRLPEEIPTLAGILGEAGYDTGAVIAAFVLHRKFGLSHDFGSYDDRFHTLLKPGALMHENRATVVTDRAIEWLNDRPTDRPFFLWTHYFDPHAPYDPPPPFRTRFAIDPYDGEVAYVDSEIGRLLDALRATGRADRTLVIVTADHGESLGDGGELTHGLLLRDATLHVPMVWAAPPVLPSGRRVQGIVSAADIAPTVLELLDVPPPDGFDGRSLLEMIGTGRSQGRSAYSMTYLPRTSYGWSDLSGVRTDEWAWVRAPDPELYAMRDDPGQTDNVHDLHPDVVSQLRAFLESVESRRAGSEALELEADDVEALRALGYVVSESAPESTGKDPKEMLPIWNETEELRGAYRAERYQEIVRRAPELLKRSPGSADVVFLMGQALVHLGRGEEGLDYLRRAFEMTGNTNRTGTALARALSELGHEEEAEVLLSSFEKTEPDFGSHPYNLGVLLASQGRDREAIEAYERAVALEPESIAFLPNLASARARTGLDPERALVLVDRAIAIAHEDDRPRLIRVRVLEALGRRGEALAEATALANAPRLREIERTEVAEVLRELR